MEGCRNTTSETYIIDTPNETEKKNKDSLQKLDCTLATLSEVLASCAKTTCSFDRGALSPRVPMLTFDAKVASFYAGIPSCGRILGVAVRLHRTLHIPSAPAHILHVPPFSRRLYLMLSIQVG